MKLAYKITLKNYKAALRLHATSKLGRRINHYFWYFGVPILAICGLMLLIFGGLSETTEIYSPFRITLWVLLWLSIYLPIMRFFNVRRGFKRIFPPTAKDKNVSIDIDDERIVSAIPGLSEGKFFWNAILEFAQDRNVTLLYLAKSRFLFFPTHAMTAEQQLELHDLIARHIVKRQP